MLTAHSDDKVVHTLYVDPSVKAFDDLEVGDVVTVRYTESVVVQVRPNAKLTELQDTTAAARKAGDANIVQQQKRIVIFEDSRFTRFVRDLPHARQSARGLPGAEQRAAQGPPSRRSDRDHADPGSRREHRTQALKFPRPRTRSSASGRCRQPAMSRIRVTIQPGAIAIQSSDNRDPYHVESLGWRAISD